MQYQPIDVWFVIDELRRRNAVHRKRGFAINDISAAMQSNHLIEEAAELQAEILNPIPEGKDHGYLGRLAAAENAILEEASHVLTVYLHLLIKLGIPLSEVSEKAVQMLEKHWTTDPDEVVAETPGQTRRGRGQL